MEFPHNFPALLVVQRSRLSLPGAQNAELRLKLIPAHTVGNRSTQEINCAAFAERLQTKGEMRAYEALHQSEEVYRYNYYAPSRRARLIAKRRST